MITFADPASSAIPIMPSSARARHDGHRERRSVTAEPVDSLTGRSTGLVRNDVPRPAVGRRLGSGREIQRLDQRQATLELEVGVVRSDHVGCLLVYPDCRRGWKRRISSTGMPPPIAREFVGMATHYLVNGRPDAN
jgi:hypothetical protein